MRFVILMAFIFSGVLVSLLPQVYGTSYVSESCMLLTISCSEFAPAGTGGCWGKAETDCNGFGYFCNGGNPNNQKACVSQYQTYIYLVYACDLSDTSFDCGTKMKARCIKEYNASGEFTRCNFDWVNATDEKDANGQPIVCTFKKCTGDHQVYQPPPPQ